MLEVGRDIEAVVLTIRRGGKRIGLGIKQLTPSPWRNVTPDVWTGRVVRGTVTRLARFGVFVRVRDGIEGLLHHSECALGPTGDLRARFPVGRELAVRVVSVEPTDERMALSVLASHGRALSLEDVDGFDAGLLEDRASPQRNGNGALARALRAALAREATPEPGDALPEPGDAPPEPGSDKEDLR